MTKAREKEIEMHPDAWSRFERAAGIVAKSPPQHRVAKKKKAARHHRYHQPGSGAAGFAGNILAQDHKPNSVIVTLQPLAPALPRTPRLRTPKRPRPQS
jgi:hypothetical protein